ncbi:MAG: CTP synthase [Candidatus Woykebacteria bacterium RIFCSPLOWO2_01_FULL_41_12]|uniref:CTP synthase (glutamine hydrolyzing) n=1 Tax=Candidatus Woykebacteria bacterium RIFCSPLOWO2_01_FULL_41_12 TaxID=1802604 RepID=A0A1G1WXY5_9BACT|nr:MAG: CTP synthase [Candidatus Woykebacteria bacterium RIFCSPLOWO2_01_FULL_41_12]
MENNLATKFIFVSGGVISGVGKGVATSSIALLLKSRGFKVTAIKADPYLNIDAGTLNPVEHGEVFVLDDGMECDQDLGNYERFLDSDLNSTNYMTSGQIFKSIIDKERALGFGGKTVEFFQDPPKEVINRIIDCAKSNKAEIVLFEIGGTVGEYQNLLFLEANRLLKLQFPSDVLHVHVTYLPIPDSVGEMKSKPAQMSINGLASFGIHADIVLARSSRSVDEKRKEKIALSSGIAKEDIISAPDINNIYQAPINLENQRLSDKILGKLNILPRRKDLMSWKRMVDKATLARGEVNIAMVGKYFATGDFTLSDSYLSVIEAIKHAANYQGVRAKFSWIDSSQIERQGTNTLRNYDGIVVPGGFGSRSVEGIIDSITFARENEIPYFGLCFGMQLATVEFARNVVGLKKAHTTEIDKKTPYPVIDVMPEQEKLLVGEEYGGTMRLGSFPCKVRKGTIASKTYGKDTIYERHRHRYEFNNKYKSRLEKNGLVISGTSPDGKLVEMIELARHPFFVGTQFHPEFKSRPLKPHPLYKKFIEVVVGRSRFEEIKELSKSIVGGV